METDLHSQYPLSRACFRIALLELLKTKTYPEIKITDIVTTSGFSRQTFYLNYRSKEEVLQEIINDLVCVLTNLIQEIHTEGIDVLLDRLTEEYHPGFLACFQYVRRNSKEIHILMNPKSGVFFQKRFYEAIAPHMKKTMEKYREIHDADEDNTMSIIYDTAMKNFLTGLLRWAAGGMEPDELYSVFTQSGAFRKNSQGVSQN